MKAWYEKQSLHPLVYFVADEPSKKNVSANVPLVGTSSYKNLLCWISDMSIDITRVKIFNQCDDPFPKGSEEFINMGIEDKRIKVVALGQNAAKYLNSSGVEEYFTLPHPSPRNRKLNDKKYMKKALEVCGAYVYTVD
jgi:hypothetical protein